MINFDELAFNRRTLQDFCSSHVPSLLFFRSDISFRLHSEESPLDDNEIHHLTTTATCLESLLDCPERFLGDIQIVPKALARDFAIRAIGLPSGKWNSEGSARIYCRCRALPLIVHHMDTYDSRLNEHLKIIFYQLIKDNRFAVVVKW